MIIRSWCLPYFSNRKVYIWVDKFDKYGDKQIICWKNDFKDLTTEGGRFHQFFKFKVKKILN